MKIIPQNEIDEAAKIYSVNHTYADYTRNDFKAGVKFVESKIEEISVEFAIWVQKSFGSIKPLYEGMIRLKCSTEVELFKQFLKERNNEKNT